jgi:CBS domain containing-hemolysin-like protein
MMTLLFIGLILAVGLLLLCSSVLIDPPKISKFELERRHKEKGPIIDDPEYMRATYYNDLLSLQKVTTSLLLVLSVIMLIAYFGWLFGFIFAVLLALEYGAIARLTFMRSISQKLYDKVELYILKFIQKYPWLIKVLRSIVTVIPETQLSSRDELLHIVAKSESILSSEEKRLVSSGLKFGSQLVKQVMTPRSVIDSIQKSELLGPLVLDDLHKTGHSRFPVIKKDLDHVVGMLYLHDLLTLDTSKKHTSKVETVMSKQVYYIHEEQTLAHALAAFLRTRHHLFIVVNEYRETVGLICLEDVIETLLGRKIIDEFDTHDDLRMVASRNLRNNNKTSATAKDI